MKKQRFADEQIIAVLKEQEAGAKTVDICRRHGILDATFYKYKAKYGGMDVSDARKLKALEDENAMLKKVASERRRFGYRRIDVMLDRQEKLMVRKRGGRKRALGTRDVLWLFRRVRASAGAWTSSAIPSPMVATFGSWPSTTTSPANAYAWSPIHPFRRKLCPRTG